MYGRAFHVSYQAKISNSFSPVTLKTFICNLVGTIIYHPLQQTNFLNHVNEDPTNQENLF